MRYSKIIVLIVLLGVAKYSFAQQLDIVVSSIAQINAFYPFDIDNPMDRKEVTQFQNFVTLKEIADTGTLLKLLGHPNAVVACYAAVGLIDKGYPELVRIFCKVLDDNRGFLSISGDMGSLGEQIATEFYFRYRNNVKKEFIKTDRVLLELDSSILFYPYLDSQQSLFYIVLQEREFPNSFIPRIRFLAFEENRINAAMYLHKWYKEKYKQEIEKAFITWLTKPQSVDDSLNGVNPEIISTVLEENTLDVKKTVVSYLNRHSVPIDNNIFLLLEKYGIYEQPLGNWKIR